MSLTLTDTDLRQLEAAATTILAPEAELPYDAWRTAVTSGLQELIGADFGVFLTDDANGLSVICTEKPPEFAQAVAAFYVSPLEVAHTRVPFSAEILSQEMIVAGDWDGYRRDPGVNEFVWPNGIRDTVGFILRRCDPLSGKIEEVYNVVYRDRYGTERFGETGTALFRILLPAFRAAFATRVRSRTHQSDREVGLGRLLDALPGGAVLVDCSGRILHESAGLARMLAADLERAAVRRAMLHTALALGTRLRRGRVADRTDARFPAAMAATTEIRTAAGRYEIRGTYARELTGDPLIVVSVERLSPGAFDRSGMRARFRLTEREFEVAELLAAGRTNAEITRAMAITAFTARRHTEHVLSKLGVANRAAVGARLREP